MGVDWESFFPLQQERGNTRAEFAEAAIRSAADVGSLYDALTKPRWTPLPHQVPPPGDFYGWLLLAGRMAGKTDACAAYVHQHVHGPPCLPGPIPHWIAIIGPTQGDAVTSCFSGPSGLSVHSPEAKLATVKGSTIVRWPNGSEAKIFGTEGPNDVDRLRSGGNRCLAWLEELAAWRHLDDAWDHMRFGLRVGPRPHWVASTTPKPKPLIKQLHSGAVANVMLTHASYRDNPHISEDIKASLEERYAGTQLGRQELYGELIEEDENALWQHTMIDEARVRPGDVPDLVRITVGVDPSGGAGEQGIVVVGKSGLVLPGDGGRPQHHGYVLDDRSCQLSPDGWGRRAVQAAIDWEADDLVVERNFGGDMAVATLRTAADALGVDIPIRTVTATRGKAVRAEPVAALTAQNRWHHAGEFPKLEDQMATWYPEAGWSPDRLDACLVAGTLVTTRRGQIPIEEVTTDDLAWTRAGWRRVTWSGMTRPSAEVMRVVTTAGAFTATPDHKVWTEQNGFIRVDEMVWGDRIDVCPNRLSRSFSTASRSLVSLCRRVARRGSTSLPTRTAGAYPGWVSSTSRSGRLRTALTKFLAAMSSTTWTSTRSTTSPATSGASPARSTPCSTNTNGTSIARNGWSTWRAFAPWLPSGTAAMRDASGIDSTARMSTPSRSTARRSAKHVTGLTRRAASRSRGTALLRACVVLLTALTGIASRRTARSAEGSSCRASISRFRRRARTRVERISALETRQPVYDLTIEGEHEFYANGILVHNCVWTAWHLKLVGTASRGQGSLGGDLARKQIVGGRVR